MRHLTGLLLKCRNFTGSFLPRTRQSKGIIFSCKKISRSLGLDALDAMVGGMSHEVNNPLAIAMGLLMQYEKLAQSEASPATLRPMQQKLDEALERIRYVVDGLKAFSQGQLDEAIQDRHVGSLCRQILNGNRLKSPHIRFRIMDATHNLKFPCRPNQLLRTLQGLIDNAIEATAQEAQPEITIRMFHEDARLILQVMDNGHGIPVALQSRIFEPFFSTKSFKVGQGLTLAAARGLMEAQGGQMSYEPLAIGSCFTLRIPCHQTTPGDFHVPVFAPFYRSVSFGKKAKKTSAALG